MSTIHCDRCGEQCDYNRSGWLAVGWKVDAGVYDREMDLCWSCFQGCAEYLKLPLQPEKEAV